MHIELAQVDVHPGFADAVVAALIVDGEASLRTEPGTLRFEVIQDAVNTNRVYIYEVYADRSGRDAHMEGEHVRRFFADAGSHIAAVAHLAIGASVFPPDDPARWGRLA